MRSPDLPVGHDRRLQHRLQGLLPIRRSHHDHVSGGYQGQGGMLAALAQQPLQEVLQQLVRQRWRVQQDAGDRPVLGWQLGPARTRQCASMLNICELPVRRWQPSAMKWQMEWWGASRHCPDITSSQNGALGSDISTTLPFRIPIH